MIAMVNPDWTSKHDKLLALARTEQDWTHVVHQRGVSKSFIQLGIVVLHPYWTQPLARGENKGAVTLTTRPTAPPGGLPSLLLPINWRPTVVKRKLAFNESTETRNKTNILGTWIQNVRRLHVATELYTLMRGDGWHVDEMTRWSLSLQHLTTGTPRCILLSMMPCLSLFLYHHSPRGLYKQTQSDASSEDLTT